MDSQTGLPSNDRLKTSSFVVTSCQLEQLDVIPFTSQRKLLSISFLAILKYEENSRVNDVWI